jgi:hypothetical protein
LQPGVRRRQHSRVPCSTPLPMCLPTCPPAHRFAQRVLTCHAAAVNHLVEEKLLLGPLLDALQNRHTRARAHTIICRLGPSQAHSSGALGCSKQPAGANPDHCRSQPAAHLLDRPFSAQSVHMNWLGLADAVHPSHGLQVRLRVPVCRRWRGALLMADVGATVRGLQVC